ncbi:hypothetical protein E6C67_11210 [Azospirillum sp. TSA2s]|uniref:hypothetical protein n=1 Tax=Azospirillum sp. TSA2s TaxID=709810 RepID=UPI0010A9CD18|nr:hypothetical protein [Azospirillum sp. TSA2s]QCG94488.1 hypothetical protein E6C67_11210 [Azospirillum sp. TSA2s]
MKLGRPHFTPVWRPVHPLRVRELKLRMMAKVDLGLKLHPLRVRRLKSVELSSGFYHRVIHISYWLQIPMKPAGYSDLKAATVPN